MARRKGRPVTANIRAKKRQPEAEDGHIKTDTPNIKPATVKGIHRIPHIICYSSIIFFPVYLRLSVLASIQGLDPQSMLSLQWDAALEQWASRVSPKLASPHLSMAFFMFQDAAFVGALAWSVFTVRLLFPFMVRC